MTKNVEISILLPFWNRESYLEETLNSIASQTYRPLHLIAFDDGSTDSSFSILSEWVKKNPDIRAEIFLNENNRGIQYARRFLASHFRSPVATWLDSDDIWLPTKLEKQITLLREQELECVYTDLRFFSMQGDSLYKFGLRKCSIAEWNSSSYKSFGDGMNYTTAMFTKKFASLLFDTPGIFAEKDTVWHWAAMRYGVKQGCIHEELYMTRKHDSRWILHERGERGKSYLKDLREKTQKSLDLITNNTKEVRFRHKKFPHTEIKQNCSVLFPGL